MKKKIFIFSVFLFVFLLMQNIKFGNSTTIEYFNNGGFESALLPFWSMYDSYTERSTIEVRTGTYSDRMQGSYAGEQYIRQDFVSTPLKEDVIDFHFYAYGLDSFTFGINVYYQNSSGSYYTTSTYGCGNTVWKLITIHNATYNIGWDQISSNSYIIGIRIYDIGNYDQYLDDFSMTATLPSVSVDSEPELNIDVTYYISAFPEDYSKIETPFVRDISSVNYTFIANEIYKENSTGTVFQFQYFSINQTLNYTDWEIDIYISDSTNITLVYEIYTGSYTTNRDRIDFIIGLVGAILFCSNPLLSYKISNNFKDKMKFFFCFMSIFLISFGLIMSFIYRGV